MANLKQEKRVLIRSLQFPVRLVLPGLFVWYSARRLMGSRLIESVG